MPRLANPLLPEDDLDQITYRLLEAGGKCVLIAGMMELRPTIDMIQRASEFFAKSKPLENGAAAHPKRQSIWIAVDGPMGSGVLLFVHPDDTRYLASTLMKELRQIGGGLQVWTVVDGEIEPFPISLIKGGNSIPAKQFLR